ncbi:MAG TPA: sigma-54 dependent transcriptional regulator [Geopsychrobacteraceae bacterium]|nr:sigma-54 dependent transcriptional regulator [Geopsychrobacteraceae bacterium]
MILSSQKQLPAVAPDLVLLQRGRGEWLVQSLSARLAEWCGLSAESVRGRAVSALFSDAVPSLIPLATDVLLNDRDLTDVKVQLVPERPALLADIQFSGLTDDYAGQLVRINFRQESVASRQETGFRGLIGGSPAMREVFRKIRLYAASDASVIITGETGVGKELVAKGLHDESERSSRSYAALNCTAISEQLLESELFGHERGAFTGAVREHRGYFERADGGTLFLDEIGDMPLQVQGKLLRVLEDGRVQRVGSEQSRQVDVRVIGATNVPLEQAVSERRFRSDLYHRLAVLRIHLPPLRDRVEDIPLLADFFLKQFTVKYQKSARKLTGEAVRLLQSYLWPGNVRELRNVLERVIVETEAEAISAKAFAEWIRERQQFVVAANEADSLRNAQDSPILLQSSTVQSYPAPGPGSQKLNRPTGQRTDLSAEAIRSAYQSAEGNLSQAARQLGIHRATLYRHLKRLDLDRDSLS